MENVNDMKRITALYNDYLSVEHSRDLIKRKITLSDYNTIKYCINDIQKNGKIETFITSIANYFKKFGFAVTMDSNKVYYIITF